MSGGHLIVLDRQGRDLKHFPLEDGFATLGSDSICDIRFMCNTVSPHHATVSVHSNQSVVHAVGTAPTLVNGAAVSVAALRHGDEISLGGRRLRWEYGSPQHQDTRPLPMPGPVRVLRTKRSSRGRRATVGGGRPALSPPLRASTPARDWRGDSSSTSGKQVAIVQPWGKDTSDENETVVKSPTKQGKRSRAARQDDSDATEEPPKRRWTASCGDSATKASMWCESRRGRAPGKIHDPPTLDHTKQAALMLMTGHTSKERTPKGPSLLVTSSARRRQRPNATRGRRSQSTRRHRGSEGPHSISLLEIGPGARRGEDFRFERKSPLKSYSLSTVLSSPKKSALKDPSARKSVRKNESIKFDLSNLEHSSDNLYQSTDSASEGDITLHYSESSSHSPSTRKNSRSSRMLETSLRLSSSLDRTGLSNQNTVEHVTLRRSLEENMDKTGLEKTRRSTLGKDTSSLLGQTLSPRRTTEHSISDKSTRRSRLQTKDQSSLGKTTRQSTLGQTTDQSLLGKTTRRTLGQTTDLITLGNTTSRRTLGQTMSPGQTLDQSSLGKTTSKRSTIGQTTERSIVEGPRIKRVSGFASVLRSPGPKKSLRGSTILKNALENSHYRGSRGSNHSESYATASPQRTMETYSLVDLVSLDSNSSSAYGSTAGLDSPVRRTRSSQPSLLASSTPYYSKTKTAPNMLDTPDKSIEKGRVSDVSIGRKKSLSVLSIRSDRSMAKNNRNKSNMSKTSRRTSLTTPENKYLSVSLNTTKATRASKSRSRINDSDVQFLEDDASPRSSRRHSGPTPKKKISVVVSGNVTPENESVAKDAGTPVLSIQNLLEQSLDLSRYPRSKKGKKGKRKTIGELSVNVKRSGKIRAKSFHVRTRTYGTDNGIVTPKSGVELTPEAVKNKHSTAKKPQSKRSLIDTLDESVVVKQLFSSPVKRNLSRSMIEFSLSREVERPATRRTLALTGRSLDGSDSILDETAKISPEIFVSPLGTPAASPNLSGVNRLFTKVSPRNDLRDVRGVKALLRTPRVRRSIGNDLTRVSGVKKTFAKSPKNRLSDVRVKELFVPSPRNDLRHVSGVKELFKSNEVRNVSSPDLRGVRSLFKKGARNELLDASDVSALNRKSPRNDLTGLEVIEDLFLEEVPGINDVSGVEELQQESEDLDSTFDRLLGRPLLKSYGKSKSMMEVGRQKQTRAAKSLHNSIGSITSNVEEWLHGQLQKSANKKARNASKRQSQKTEAGDSMFEASLQAHGSDIVSTSRTSISATGKSSGDHSIAVNGSMRVISSVADDSTLDKSSKTGDSLGSSAVGNSTRGRRSVAGLRPSIRSYSAGDSSRTRKGIAGVSSPARKSIARVSLITQSSIAAVSSPARRSVTGANSPTQRNVAGVSSSARRSVAAVDSPARKSVVEISRASNSAAGNSPRDDSVAGHSMLCSSLEDSTRGRRSNAVVSSSVRKSSAADGLRAPKSIAGVSSPARKSVARVSSPARKSVAGVSSPIRKSVTGVSSPTQRKSVVGVDSPNRKSVAGVSSSARQSVAGVSSPPRKSVAGVSSPTRKSVAGVSSSTRRSVAAVNSPIRRSDAEISRAINNAVGNIPHAGSPAGNSIRVGGSAGNLRTRVSGGNLSRELQKLATATVDGTLPVLAARGRSSVKDQSSLPIKKRSLISLDRSRNATQRSRTEASPSRGEAKLSRSKREATLSQSKGEPPLRRSRAEATLNSQEVSLKSEAFSHVVTAKPVARLQLPIKKRVVIHSTPMKGADASLNVTALARMSPIASVDSLSTLVGSPKTAKSKTAIQLRGIVETAKSPKRSDVQKPSTSLQPRATRARKNAEAKLPTTVIRKRKSITITKKSPVLSPKAQPVDTPQPTPKRRNTRSANVVQKNKTPPKPRARARRASLVVAKKSPKLKPQRNVKVVETRKMTRTRNTESTEVELKRVKRCIEGSSSEEEVISPKRSRRTRVDVFDKHGKLITTPEDSIFSRARRTKITNIKIGSKASLVPHKMNEKQTKGRITQEVVHPQAKTRRGGNTKEVMENTKRKSKSPQAKIIRIRKTKEIKNAKQNSSHVKPIKGRKTREVIENTKQNSPQAKTRRGRKTKETENTKQNSPQPKTRSGRKTKEIENTKQNSPQAKKGKERKTKEMENTKQNSPQVKTRRERKIKEMENTKQNSPLVKPKKGRKAQEVLENTKENSPLVKPKKGRKAQEVIENTKENSKSPYAKTRRGGNTKKVMENTKVNSKSPQAKIKNTKQNSPHVNLRRGGKTQEVVGEGSEMENNINLMISPHVKPKRERRTQVVNTKNNPQEKALERKTKVEIENTKKSPGTKPKRGQKTQLIEDISKEARSAKKVDVKSLEMENMGRAGRRKVEVDKKSTNMTNKTNIVAKKATVQEVEVKGRRKAQRTNPALARLIVAALAKMNTRSMTVKVSATTTRGTEAASSTKQEVDIARRGNKRKPNVPSTTAAATPKRRKLEANKQSKYLNVPEETRTRRPEKWKRITPPHIVSEELK